MNEIDKTNLTDQTKFRLGEITKIKNYFNKETNQRKSCSKKLSKYVAAFDDIDNVLIFFKWNKWWTIYHFFYKCCWSSCRNSKRKFYFNLFFNQRNN